MCIWVQNSMQHNKEVQVSHLRKNLKKNQNPLYIKCSSKTSTEHFEITGLSVLAWGIKQIRNAIVPCQEEWFYNIEPDIE